jgi:crotonobetainyl-CoA:carnitine CoA-transferase CaiB-like acyl-CoA transferase
MTTGEVDVSQPKSEGPLAGVTVIEICQALAGPYACMMLSDMGARVIKIEKPGGDDSRGMPPHFVKGTSTYFMSINRGKESIVLDLKTAAAREVLLKLVAKADIVVENNRPGVLDRLGLSFEAFKAVNPKIVLCSISGFGQDGPYRDLPAYDMIVQAMSGGMSVTGEPAGKPVRSGVPIGDMGAGMTGALAAVSALHAARVTGEAQHADVAMLDVQVSMLSYQMAHHLATGVVPTLQGRAHSGISEMGAYESQDGIEVLIAPLAAHMWPWVCKGLDMPKLAEDPRFATRAERVKNRPALREIIQTTFKTRTAAEWIKRMRDAGVPVACINDFAAVIADPQIQHRGMVAHTDYDGVPVRLIGSPLKFAGVEQHYKSPPALGADGQSILKNDLGMNDAQIKEIIQSTQAPHDTHDAKSGQ